MGIRFYCPNGHKLHVKAFQAGLRGICPYCGTPVDIPLQSTRPSSKEERLARKRAARGQGAGDQPIPILQKPAGGVSGGRAGAQASAVGNGGQPSPAAGGNAGMAARSPPGAAEATVPRGKGFGGAHGGQVRAEDRPVAAPGGAAPAGTQPVAPPPAVQATHNLSVLDEAPNAVWYVRPSAGGQYGPATPDVIRVWLAEGRIAGDTLVWREGWRDWREAGEVFPQMAPSPDDAMPSLRSIIEEEVYALGPGGTSPGQAAESASAHSNSALVMVLLAGLVVLATAILGLWMWLDRGS